MQVRQSLFLLILFLITSLPSVWAYAPLPAAQAFNFQTNVDAQGQLTLQWNMPKGYFLYAKRLTVKLDPLPLIPITIPQGEFKYTKGEREEVLKGLVRIPITLNKEYARTNLKIYYQGCSQDGFCYPPINKEFYVNSIDKNTTLIEPASSTPDFSLASWISLYSDHQQIFNLLHQQNQIQLMLIFFALGIFLAFTPCTLPMVPILTSILVGRKNLSSLKAFQLSLGYVMGMAFAYALVGLMVARLGSTLHVYFQQSWVLILTSIIFLLLSLSLLDVYEVQLPNLLRQRLNQLNQRFKGGSFSNTFLMGIFSTLIISPCITAPLVGVLMFIAATGNQFLGALTLAIMGLGMGLPLLCFSTSLGRWLPKSGPWLNASKYLMGFIMMAMAIWLISRVISAYWGNLLWSIFIAILTMFMTLKLFPHKRWRNELGILIAALSLMVTLGSAVYFPSQHKTDTFFTSVGSISELKEALDFAQKQNQPVLIDFYAKWCESCLDMEKKVFANQAVKAKLSNFTVIRADLSANNQENHALMQKYAVLAPPTILFLNRQGKELTEKRIVGEIDSEAFLSKIPQTL